MSLPAGMQQKLGEGMYRDDGGLWRTERPVEGRLRRYGQPKGRQCVAEECEDACRVLETTEMGRDAPERCVSGSDGRLDACDGTHGLFPPPADDFISRRAA